jgi:hypothetical protein
LFIGPNTEIARGQNPVEANAEHRTSARPRKGVRLPVNIAGRAKEHGPLSRYLSPQALSSRLPLCRFETA